MYEDIKRVLEYKKEELLSHHIEEKEKLEEIFDKLQRKHMYFQILETHREQKRFPSTDNTLVAYFQQVSQPAKGDKGDKYLKDFLNKFEWVNTITIPLPRKFPYPQYFVMRDFIGDEIKGFQSIAVDIDFLLDHGSLFIEYLSDTLQSSHNSMLFEAFTGLIPEKLRRRLSITNGSKRTGLAD